MSRGSVNDIAEYKFEKDESLFFDANVWLLLFPPVYQASTPRIKVYSEAFKKIQAAGNGIYCDVLVLSEFVNRSARVAMKSAGKADFKQFRNSPEYRPVAQQIALIMSQIARLSIPVESGYSGLEQQVFCDRFGRTCADFNDEIIAELCKQREFTLVTDDYDFQGSSVKILTGNHRLLQQR